MKIEFLGHSCFVLTDEAGTRIVTDPYGGIGFSMPSVSADAVTVSHSHYDHDRPDLVGGSPIVFRDAGEYRIGKIALRAIPSYHDDVCGKKRGGNLIFMFEIDGLRVCHLGDLGEPFTEERAASVSPADVLLIPVGGVFTIGAGEAKKYADAISPAVVIPMHYAENGLNFKLEGLQEFARLFRKDEVVRQVHSIDLHRGGFTEERKIILMER